MSAVQLGHLKGSQLKCNAGLIVVGLIQQEYFLSGLTGYTDKLFSTPVVGHNHLVGQLLCIALLIYVASYMSQGSLEHLLMLLGYVTKALFPDAMCFPKTLHQLLKLFNLTPISKEYACCPSCFALYDVSSFSPQQSLHPFHAASCPLELEGDSALQYASVEAQRFLANAPMNQDDEHLPFPYTLTPRLEPCCTHQSVQIAVPCNALTHDKGQGHYVPLRKYVVLEIFDYLAWLHACPQFEEYLEQSMREGHPAGDGMKDVMDRSYSEQQTVPQKVKFHL